jgi:3-oxoacyl-[acyl-carrier protein] reductase
MSGLLRGRTAIITGSGRGIGAATARLFGREGARVVVNDLDPTVADATAAAIVDAGGEAIAISGSVMDEPMPNRLVEAALEAFGTPDVIVNNAGFLWDGMLHKMTDQQWDAVVACHLTVPFRLVRAASPYIRAAAKEEVERDGAPRDRAIVNVSSTSGLHGNAGQANYAAAKAGVVGLTKTMAKEMGPLGVRANAVAFGMIDTRMTSAFDEGETVEMHGEAVPQGLPSHVADMWQSQKMLRMVVPLARKGRAEEAAGGIVFLASPLASYVSGHTLEVTGGMGI